MNQDQLTDQALDQLFAQARAQGQAEAGAAERFLVGHRARQRHMRQVRAGWVSALLASAAMVTGLMVLRPASSGPNTLPSSAAYQVYEGALGEGW